MKFLYFLMINLCDIHTLEQCVNTTHLVLNRDWYNYKFYFKRKYFFKISRVLLHS